MRNLWDIFLCSSTRNYIERHLFGGGDRTTEVHPRRNSRVSHSYEDIHIYDENDTSWTECTITGRDNNKNKKYFQENATLKDGEMTSAIRGRMYSFRSNRLTDDLKIHRNARLIQNTWRRAIAKQNLWKLKWSVRHPMYVKIIQGDDLVSRSLSSSNPYVILSSHSIVHQFKRQSCLQLSKCIKTSTHPEWNEVIIMPAIDPNSALVFTVLHKNRISPHEFMGQAVLPLIDPITLTPTVPYFKDEPMTLPLSHLQVNPSKDGFLIPFEAVNGKVQGTLTLQVKTLPLSTSASGLLYFQEHISRSLLSGPGVWKLRWFVLAEGKIYTYKHKNAWKPKLLIDLKDITSVSYNCLRVGEARTFSPRLSRFRLAEDPRCSMERGCFHVSPEVEFELRAYLGLWQFKVYEHQGSLESILKMRSMWVRRIKNAICKVQQQNLNVPNP